MNIDEYIAETSPEVQKILKRIRRMVRKLAPEAEERISYRMPAFALDGMLLYFAAFKSHIGIFPPVKGDARFRKDAAPYRGPKGNFKFPLDQPMPYDLIERIVRVRLEEHRERRSVSARRGRKKASRPRHSAG